MASLPTSASGSNQSSPQKKETGGGGGGDGDVERNSPRLEDMFHNSLPNVAGGDPRFLRQTGWAYVDPRSPRPDIIPVYGPTLAYPSLNSLYDTEEVATGLAFDGGLSPVRRFFCLFVTFDFLLTGLMWLLTIVITGANLKTGMVDQITHYTIYNSLFDLVFLSAFRFLFLIFVFGLCRFNHWWPVAATTTGCCIFLVTKVFFYEWTRHSTYMFEVVFLLTGFILPWGEAWFVDFRVIPLETKASKLFIRPVGPTERSPLLGPQSFRGPGSVIASVSQFYSPLASSGGSEYGEDERPITKYMLYSSKGKAGFTEQEERYRAEGKEILNLCWDLLLNANWVRERASATGELMFSARHPDMRMKMYKITARLDCSPKDLLHEVFYNAEEAPNWNANLKVTSILQIVDEFTDVIYQVTNEAAGGLISSRDFIDLRHWAIMEGGVYLSTGRSIEHPAMPPQPRIVRGENGPSCIALFPVPGSPDESDLQAMVQTDLKGWIPQKVIDQAMRDVMFKSVEFIRKRIPEIKASKRMPNA